MRLAILSDIHGNEVAFRNCLEYISGIGADELFFLGDAMGYLPNGSEVIDLLHMHGFQCLMGNHDAMGLGLIETSRKKEEVYQLEQAVSRLTDSQLEVVSNWSRSFIEPFGDKLFHMVHGSPAHPLTEYIYPDSDLTGYEGMTADVLLMGHTHRPFIRRAGDKTIINVGSVGLPRDVGNLSCICVIETEPFTVRHVRIPFSADEALAISHGTVHQAVRDCFLRRAETYVGEQIIN